MIDRRQVLTAISALPALSLARPAASAATARLTSGISRDIAALEARSGGRLGVAVLDTADGKAFAHRGDERFALCSTFKALVAGLVLKRVDQGQERLDRRIRYGRGVLTAHSPATEKHVGEGMTVGALCEATVTLSDNAAANLLLHTFGGPPALTAFLRGLGDTVTRLDGYEPALNVVRPGEIHDTTSPSAMLASLRALTLGPVLSPASRQQLAAWLVGNQTGDKRLRAGLPPDWKKRGWKVGDKTGSWGDGRVGTTNDIAMIWPPGRPPLLITAYLSRSTLDDNGRNAVIAEVARLAVAAGFGS
ncbi:class A beta-lactamase [Caulobacter sp. UNC279MFTsu5.1]|uniref:class A beta-lactamase n=1 Tax=Caulobacter sp. UNC279MFTsu5.1 TaxID=1502775 RepID=UPI0003A05471|nr:class A beta-lactamase [Caulobacter sp. UNC279MFTsu5.1]SFI82378.1 beta-lactamase class A [Caulobacter sp. UNC279MFTsu5.1]